MHLMPRTHPARVAIDSLPLATRRFLAIERTLARHGGFVSGEELALRVRRHRDQPLSIVAKWLVAGEIISIVWQAQMLIPMFQFDHRDLSLRRCVTRVADELRSTFDDRELLAWFAEPHPRLLHEAPVDRLEDDDEAVVQAARSDRFFARG